MDNGLSFEVSGAVPATGFVIEEDDVFVLLRKYKKPADATMSTNNSIRIYLNRMVFYRKFYGEGRALLEFTVYPYNSVMLVHNLFGDR